MKKLLSSLLMLMMVISLSSVAIAQDDTDTDTDVTPKDRLMEIRDTHKDRIQEIKTESAEKRDAIKDGVSDRRYRMRGLILHAFQLRIAHLEHIMARINLRIEKLGERDTDTDEAKEIMILAAESLENAKGHLAEAETAWEEGDDIETLRGLLNTVKDDLKEAHRHLRDAVRSLRASLGEGSDDEEEEEVDEEENEEE